jgi:leader peptidase (prepilin peptidase) / N-methyltransferase
MGVWPIIILFLLIGLSLGSFLNVVIYRLPRGMSLALPRSHCPSCKKSIHYFDNVPLLSFMLLGGRCRHCRSAIPWRYPLVEALSAVLLVSLFLKFQLTPATLIYGVLFGLLIPITFIDIDRMIIPDKLTAPGFILGLGLVFGFHFLSWKSVLLGIAVPGPALWLLGWVVSSLLKKEALGFGDVKFLIMAGTFLGFGGVVLALLFGAVLSLIFLAFGAALKRLSLKSRLPFGPFIALGIIVYVYFGHEIVNWYFHRILLGF